MLPSPYSLWCKQTEAKLSELLFVDEFDLTCDQSASGKVSKAWLNWRFRVNQGPKRNNTFQFHPKTVVEGFPPIRIKHLSDGRVVKLKFKQYKKQKKRIKVILNEPWKAFKLLQLRTR